MDKKQLQIFTECTKIELRKAIVQRAFEYGVTKDNYEQIDGSVLKNKVLSNQEKNQREKLVCEIKDRGFDEVIDEVTYTWFNRFVALRFMEVNGYLPSKTRVLSDESNNFNPQIVKEALELDFEDIDKNIIADYLEKNETESLYRYLIIAQCNELYKIIPILFEKISGYTELLLPNGLLNKDSFLANLVSFIPEDDWKDQVEIIGWIYESYVSTDREKMRKLQYINKNTMAVVNQVFTPDWIVRYMVENSLGKIWMESYPNSPLKNEMKFYVDNKKQDCEIIDSIRYKNINPEDLKVIEPCCGSGHILVYLFDILVKMYEEKGYKKTEIPALIFKNNLYGLDIDKRASQLAYFALLMKARSIDYRIFSRGTVPHVNVLEIIDSSRILEDNYLDILNSHNFSSEIINISKYLVETFKNGKVIGSALVLDDKYDYDKYINELKNIDGLNVTLLDSHFFEYGIKDLIKLAELAKVLSTKYDVVITNPPYSVIGKLEDEAKAYISKYYETSNPKCNFCSVFIDNYLTKKNGYCSMITSSLWRVQDSFTAFRKKTLSEKSFTSLVEIGEGEVNAMVDVLVSIYKNTNLVNTCSYFSLKGADNKKDVNKTLFNTKPIEIDSSLFKNNESYAISLSTGNNVDIQKKVADYATGKDGLHTGDNDKFLRLWHEVDVNRINFSATSNSDALSSKKKWFPYTKGGVYRQYYGNNEFVINWENDGYDVKHNFDEEKGKLKSHGFNNDFAFKEGATWTYRVSTSFSIRYSPVGFMFDGKGSKIFPKENNSIYALLGLLNSKVAKYYMGFNATTAYEVSTITKVPFVESINTDETIINLSKNNVEISKNDWDSFENSWDFKKHPLLLNTNKIALAFESWSKTANDRFNQLLDNESVINKKITELYGLSDKVDSTITDIDISIRKSDKERDIKSLISYIIGLNFGRYSLDEEGLAYAGGDFDLSKYKTIIPDKDNIIPVCDDEYFEDDLCNLVIDSIKKIYGEDTLEENLNFIAEALGGKGSSREVLRNYLLNDFYKDHLKIYQKRPIYWLFDSGKKNGFKALIYMHRYSPDLLAKMRTDYVHEQQERYRTQIDNIKNELIHLDGANKVKAEKKLAKLNDQLKEINVFEEKIHHLADQMISIDLDDGVKVNYAIFENILAEF